MSFFNSVLIYSMSR